MSKDDDRAESPFTLCTIPTPRVLRSKRDYLEQLATVVPLEQFRVAALSSAVKAKVSVAASTMKLQRPLPTPMARIAPPLYGSPSTASSGSSINISPATATVLAKYGPGRAGLGAGHPASPFGYAIVGQQAPAPTQPEVPLQTNPASASPMTPGASVVAAAGERWLRREKENSGEQQQQLAEQQPPPSSQAAQQSPSLASPPSFTSPDAFARRLQGCLADRLNTLGEGAEEKPAKQQQQQPRKPQQQQQQHVPEAPKPSSPFVPTSPEALRPTLNSLRGLKLGSYEEASEDES